MTKHFESSAEYGIDPDQKYYCCTFRAKSKAFKDYKIWWDVMDYHPVEYLIRCLELASESDSYEEYTIINTLEITKDHYNKLIKLT
jgi:hypothetical protein